jgi:trigger factor
VNEHFAWDAEELVFEWISSDFVLDLEAKNDIVKYVVTADDKLIDGQVERIKNNLVQLPQEEVVAGADLTGTFTNEEKELITQQQSL